MAKWFEIIQPSGHSELASNIIIILNIHSALFQVKLFLISAPVWPVKSHEMSIKVAQNDFARNMKDFDNFIKKLPKNVGDLGKKLLPQALKSCPNSNKCILLA